VPTSAQYFYEYAILGENFIKNEFSRPKGDIILNSLVFLYKLCLLNLKAIFTNQFLLALTFFYIAILSNTPKRDIFRGIFLSRKALCFDRIKIVCDNIGVRARH